MNKALASLGSIAVISLMACSGTTFTNNAGPFVRAEISSEVVKKYTLQEIQYYNGEFVASVNSSVCSQTVDDIRNKYPKNASISYEHLVRDLHVKTQLSGGNALVVHQCTPSALAGCYKGYQCSGSSYWVDSGK